MLTEQEVEQMRDKIEARLARLNDDGESPMYAIDSDQMVVDVLSWVLGDGDAPDGDDE